ncbi:MAG: DUF116 domain-containing protein [bacterium]
MKRFYIITGTLFLFFALWTTLVVFLSVHYNSWGLLVIGFVPLFASLLFVNLILSVCCVLGTLFLAYPIMELTANMLRLDFDRFRREIINYSNHHTLAGIEKEQGSIKVYKSSDILVLLPHCLQNSECLYKVTWDKLDNCRSCGKCCIPVFTSLRDKYGIGIVVVSGGTAAREIIKQKRPKFIIAVACENDLISGLRDVKGIPVIAVLNKRTSGPCRDTTVDISVIESYLDRIIK